MFKFIIWGVVIYLIYKFVFELIVPVSKAATKMQDKIKEMQEMQQRQMQQQQAQEPVTQAKSKATPNSDDYIDYEEVK